MLTIETLSPQVHAVRARIIGELVLPGDPNWDEARPAWNLAVDQNPGGGGVPGVGRRRGGARGVRCAPPACASPRRAPATTPRAIELAGRHDPDEDLRACAPSEVDAGSASRGSRPARWGEVDRRGAEHGLAALAGSSPDVGVVGYTLGGGLSWLARTTAWRPTA